MTLYSTKKMLEHARKHKYAVPAFNITDMQSIQAAVSACEMEKAPCLLQAGEKTTDLYGADYIAAIAKVAASKATVPVALHLDHGYRIDSVMNAIRAGFSSVMIDASKLPLNENIETTRRIVEIAHACGVAVEGEIGHVGRDDIALDTVKKEYTDPQEAVKFVEETKVDFLAIAVGTAHGVYSFEPKIELELLKEIGEKISIPLVLHGASSTPGLKETPPLGISKVNLFTDLQKPLIDKALEIIESTPRNKLKATVIWEPANKASIPIMREYINLLGAANRIKGDYYEHI